MNNNYRNNDVIKNYHYRNLTTIIMDYPMSWMFRLPESGVFALINRVNRKVYVWYSCNPLESLMRIIDNINKRASKDYIELADDKLKLKFAILESNPADSEMVLLAKCNYWKAHYRNKNYSLYNRSNSIHYEAKIEFDIAYNTLVFAKKGSNKTLIAVFKTKREAVKWLKRRFKYGVILPIPHNNDLTVNYLSRINKRDTEQARTLSKPSRKELVIDKEYEDELEKLLQCVEYEDEEG